MMQTSDASHPDSDITLRGVVWLFRCFMAGLVVLHYLLLVVSSIGRTDVFAYDGIDEDSFWILLFMLEYLFFLLTAYFAGVGTVANPRIYQQWLGGMRHIRFNILYITILRVGYPFIVEATVKASYTAGQSSLPRSLAIAPPLPLLLILPLFMLVTSCAAAGLAVAFGILATRIRRFRLVLIVMIIGVLSLLLLPKPRQPVPETVSAMAVSLFDAGTTAIYPVMPYQHLRADGTPVPEDIRVRQQKPIHWPALLVPFFYIPLTALVLGLAQRLPIPPPTVVPEPSGA